MEEEPQEMPRANRRHHKERMKAKAKRIAGAIWGYALSGFERDDIVENAVKNADHLKACSCEMCCNPRRSGWVKGKGKTFKEIQAEDDLRDELPPQ